MNAFAPIKIILIIFALFAWSRAYIKFRVRLMNAKELVFWSLVWIIAILAVLVPGKTTYLAHLLGMDRGFDALVFIAIVALFYAVYRLYMKSNEFEQETTRLVRKIALKIGISTNKRQNVKKLRRNAKANTQ